MGLKKLFCGSRIGQRTGSPASWVIYVGHGIEFVCVE
jgi:hypothetical protein